jgi:hypothetical protein
MLDIFRRGEVLREGRTNEQEVRLIELGRCRRGMGRKGPMGRMRSKGPWDHRSPIAKGAVRP